MKMNKKTQKFIEELSEHMSKRSLCFSTHSHNEACELHVTIMSKRSVRDIIEHACEKHIIDENLQWELITHCYLLWSNIDFYTEHDDTGFYVKYSCPDKDFGHFVFNSGVLLAPGEKIKISPWSLGNRITGVIDKSFRTMNFSNGIILDIPKPKYSLYDDGHGLALNSFAQFAQFVSDVTMLR